MKSPLTRINYHLMSCVKSCLVDLFKIKALPRRHVIRRVLMKSDLGEKKFILTPNCWGREEGEGADGGRQGTARVQAAS